MSHASEWPLVLRQALSARSAAATGGRRRHIAGRDSGVRRKGTRGSWEVRTKVVAGTEHAYQIFLYHHDRFWSLSLVLGGKARLLGIGQSVRVGKGLLSLSLRKVKSV